ncbi:hypothetical protein YB2330_005786 [Saitoella coloradoensis]
MVRLLLQRSLVASRLGLRGLKTSSHLDPVPYAFAFDIDGVLLKGSDPIPRAREALKLLETKRIPYMLLTNGGGTHESDRVRYLSSKLGVQIDERQFVQSHTPFKEMTGQFDNVLVCGGNGDTCRKVAETYGFKNVVVPGDIVKWNSSVWPWHNFRFDGADKEWPKPKDFFAPEQKIDAIFVYHDPRDWGVDSQIILDLLLSKGGQQGTWSKTFDEGPPIYFSNPDLIWANQYPIPRFGQGAFRLLIEALYREMSSGKELKSTIIGKPHKLTYDYAVRVLSKWRAECYGVQAGEEMDKRRVYMVGDNPESDIRGANDNGLYSILVRTGVFRDAVNSDKYPAKKVCADVLEAVEFAIEREEGRAVESAAEKKAGIA